jgi:tetratricopeptide (TPR) repeat protein
MAFLSPSGRPILLVTGFQGPGTFPRVLVSAREAWAQVSTWEASLEQNPDDAEALVKLGAYLFEQEAYEDSRDLLARATAKDAKRPVEDRKEARMMLAIIRHYERRYADAEALLKEALGLEPPGAYDAQMLYVLGRTYKAWGRLDQARPVLERVVRTYPESPFAQRAQETLVALGRSR